MDGIKRNSTILLLGTNLDDLSRIAGKVSEILKGFDLDWNPGYQCAVTFESAFNLLRIGLKPNVILIMNPFGMKDHVLRDGCKQLAADLNARDLKPWIAIEDGNLAHLVGIFTDHGIIAYHATLGGVITDEEDAREHAEA